MLKNLLLEGRKYIFGKGDHLQSFIIDQKLLKLTQIY